MVDQCILTQTELETSNLQEKKAIYWNIFLAMKSIDLNQ